MTAPDFPREDSDAQAAWWFARLRSGEAAATDRAAFDAWRHTDPANAEASDRYSALWALLGEVRDEPSVLELRDGLRRPRRQPWRYAVAAIAMLGAASATLWWPHDPNRAGVPAALADQPVVTRFETGIGQVSRLALADGSTVVLDTDSALKAEFDGASRRISLLHGRAFFHVAHEARPFTVTGRRLAVTATGTQFVVDLDNGSDIVSMVEGSVLAAGVGTGGQQPVALKAGRSLAAGAGGWRLGKVDIDQARGWTTGQLTFRNAPLEEVVRETNRYSPRKIVLGDGVGGERLSAVLKAGDVDTLVSAVEDLGIARVSARDSGAITLSRR